MSVVNWRFRLHQVLKDKTLAERVQFMVRYAHLHHAKLKREGRDAKGLKIRPKRIEVETQA